MTNSLVLTNSQQIAFDKIVHFLTKDTENPAIVLNGQAGTGKSTLMKYIVDYISDNINTNVAAITPTHKARRILHKMLNSDRICQISTMTVASILGKMKEHSYIGTKLYTRGSTQKMDDYSIFILDEVSMVLDRDLDTIINYICVHDKKIIMIGDNCQIPCPSQKLIHDFELEMCYKPDSYAFDIENIITLTEIVRQAKESPIIKIATYLRENIMRETCLKDIISGTGLEFDDICKDNKVVYDMFTDDLKKGDISTRIIAYTNANVQSHNLQVRKVMGFNDVFVVGELLTGYNNVGFPTPIIENGCDYQIIKFKFVCNKKILNYENLAGHVIDIKNVDDNTITNNLFFISVNHTNNTRFMSDIVKLAEKVNSVRSTKNDFKEYSALKNRSIFIQDVYKFQNKITLETEFKQNHPLLFTRVSEVINVNNKTKCSSELVRKIEELYDDIIDVRLGDNKDISDNEVLSDKFKVLEKDVYYGYAITSHKSQGSTYKNVYVDEHDFKKLSNKWNYRYQAVENRFKEQNQLKYVAYTRSSDKLVIFV